MTSPPPVHYFSFDRLAEMLAENPDAKPEAIEAIVKRLNEVHEGLEQIFAKRTINLIPNESEDYILEHTAQVIALTIQLEIRFRQLPASVSALVEIARECLVQAPVGQGGSA